MKDYSKIESKLAKLQEDLLTTSSILSIHKEKVNSLLLLTESVNKNFNSAAIVSLLDSNLKNLMKVQSYSLIVNTKGWNLMLNQGHPLDMDKLDLDDELLKISKHQTTKKFKNEQLRKFEYVIPVLHKSEHLAFLLIDDIQLRYIDCTVFEKLRYIETVLNLTIISLENKKLFRKLYREDENEDLVLAAEVQAELIPSIFPANKHYEFFGKYIPFNSIGGDYYDLIPVSDEKVAFCICDVSGKGISAGMLMSNFQASLRTMANRHSSLKELVVALNEKFINVTKQTRFITMFIGLYNTKTRELEYINAGHNPPLLRNNNKYIELNKGCTILGMIKDLSNIVSEKIKIDKGSMLVMYTDGLTEIQNEKDVEFGLNGIEKFTEKNLTASLPEFTAGLINEVEIYRGGNEIFDDVSLLCARFK